VMVTRKPTTFKPKPPVATEVLERMEKFSNQINF
jgi:hypothetical protein